MPQISENSWTHMLYFILLMSFLTSMMFFYSVFTKKFFSFKTGKVIFSLV